MCFKENWQSYQVSPAVPLPKKCYCHRASETREHVDAFSTEILFLHSHSFAPLDASIQFGVFYAVYQRRIPLTSVYYITVSGFNFFEATNAPQTKRFQRFHPSHYGSPISPFPLNGPRKGFVRTTKGLSTPRAQPHLLTFYRHSMADDARNQAIPASWNKDRLWQKLLITTPAFAAGKRRWPSPARRWIANPLSARTRGFESPPSRHSLLS